jgi:hypothetical protein
MWIVNSDVCRTRVPDGVEYHPTVGEDGEGGVQARSRQKTAERQAKPSFRVLLDETIDPAVDAELSSLAIVVRNAERRDRRRRPLLVTRDPAFLRPERWPRQHAGIIVLDGPPDEDAAIVSRFLRWWGPDRNRLRDRVFRLSPTGGEEIRRDGSSARIDPDAPSPADQARRTPEKPPEPRGPLQETWRWLRYLLLVLFPPLLLLAVPNAWAWAGFGLVYVVAGILLTYDAKRFDQLRPLLLIPIGVALILIGAAGIAGRFDLETWLADFLPGDQADALVTVVVGVALVFMIGQLFFAVLGDRLRERREELMLIAFAVAGGIILFMIVTNGPSPAFLDWLGLALNAGWWLLFLAPLGLVLWEVWRRRRR